MDKAIPLTPLDGPPDGPTGIRDIGGPLRPPAHRQGDMNLTCPTCGTVVVEKTTAADAANIKGLQCYVCGAWATGKADASPEAGP